MPAIDLTKLTDAQLAAAASQMAGINERGYGCNPYRDEINRRAVARAAESFAAEWTLAETQARRAAWNEFIRSIAEGSRVDMRKVAERERTQGWRADHLKRALVMHGLIKG